MPPQLRLSPSSASLSRRAFLGSTAAAGAALAFPRLLLAQDKSGLKLPIVGSGAHQYEVFHDWAQLPPNIAFGNTHGVCEDSERRIYIKHTVHASSQSPDAIAVFDKQGKFIRSWGAEFKGGAHGLNIHKERDGEFLFLCDFLRGKVVKTNLAGEVVWTLGAPLESGLYNDASEFKPTNVAITPNGLIFVADGYGKSWIHMYRTAMGPAGDPGPKPDRPPTYASSFGGPGKERGQVSCPHGLMIDSRGDPRLVVADRSNRRLQYFDLDGRHDRFVTDELRSPCHFDQRGDVLLVPDLEARVTLLDKANKLICHLGDGGSFALRDKPRDQFVPGRFIAPHSSIFDRDGNIFVVEWVEIGRVTKLRKLS